MLDGGRVQFVRQLLVHGFARSAVVAQHTHLDQTVGIEGGVGFLQHGRGEAIGADHDDGRQVMGFCTVRLALLHGQYNLRHGGIILKTVNRRLRRKIR